MTLPDRAALPVAGAVNVLAALLEARSGQQIAANRAWRIETVLKPLLHRQGLESLDALVGAILGGRAPDLADAVVDALLNQESSFFRDAAVFATIGEAAAVAARDGGRRLRVWSAGCSTGQEPLSLAMMFAERASSMTMPEIVATDISETALARARQGRYSQFEIQRGLAVTRMVRWFDQKDEAWIAHRALVDTIRFQRHNLLADRAPAGRFDIILCRNVLMYLMPAVRRDALARFAEAMRPGGVLVLGAGETVIGHGAAFAPSRRFRGFYEPVAAAAAEPRRAIG